jgi:N-glycosylase/DNA lyase
MRHRLSVPGPLDLALTFTCGQAFRWRPAGTRFSGVVGGAELRVARSASQGRTTLEVEVLGSDPGRDALTRYFRLDEDPRVHLEHAEELRAVPGLVPLLGLRLLRQEPWETLASFICSAAANVRKISGSIEGIAERWGATIAGSRRRAFPPPQRLARVKESELRALGLGFRSPYLLASAKRVASPSWSWEELRGLGYDEARARLVELPGVGPKIADCTLLFGLDRLEAYPVDRWIRRATRELAARHRAGDEELARWAVRFGPGRGYLQQLLFHLRRTSGPLPALRGRAARMRRTA